MTDMPCDVFRGLHDVGVHYAVWKDVEAIDVFDSGDAELDLIVAPVQREAFREVATRHGFAEYRSLVDIYAGQITHFIRFHDAKHFHLHVHYSLLTGDHLVKELCLDRLFANGWGEPATRRGVRTLEPDGELLVGLVRLVAKAGSARGMGSAELHRLRSIFDANRYQRALDKLGAHVRFSAAARARIRSCLEGDDEHLHRLGDGRGELRSLRRISPTRAVLYAFIVRLSAMLSGWLGLSNKVLRGEAPCVAVVGVDGVGKSALVGRLHAAVRSKTSARRVYLGGNARTYGMWTWTTRILWRASALLRSVLPAAAFMDGPYYVLLALFEHAKCVDRVHRIRAAKRFARLGVVTVFERYPIRGLFDYPYFAYDIRDGSLRVAGVAGRAVHALLARIDRALDAQGWPDIVVLLDTPYEVIASRRTLGSGAQRETQCKLRILSDFRGRGLDSSIVTVTNDRPIEASVAELCERLNRELCSSSS